MADVSEPADLYGLPLEEFTEQRNLLARRLRDQEEGEEASRVAALRKPTTDAWALNQVARSHPDLIENLIAVQQRLREAITGDAMRQASEERLRLVDDIGDAAAAVLDESGKSSTGSVRERITLTLLATVSDREAEQALTQGTLERQVEISADWPPTLLPPREGTSPIDTDRAEEVERLETQLDELTNKAEQLRREANEAREALDAARDRAQLAEQAVREADKAAREAEKELKRVRRR